VSDDFIYMKNLGENVMKTMVTTLGGLKVSKDIFGFVYKKKKIYSEFWGVLF